MRRSIEITKGYLDRVGTPESSFNGTLLEHIDPGDHDESPVAFAGGLVLRQLDAVQVALLAVALDGRHRLRVVEGALEGQVVDLGQQELVKGDPGVLGHSWTH